MAISPSTKLEVIKPGPTKRTLTLIDEDVAWEDKLDRVQKAMTDEPVVAGQVVYMKSNGILAIASSNNVNLRHLAGLAFENKNIGDTVRFGNFGVLTLLNWTAIVGTEFLTAGQEYFLGLNGNLAATPPTTGISVVVGYATTTTSFNISIGEIVILLS